MIVTIIMFIISVFLEGLVPNLLREITPFFVIAIIIIGSFNVKDKKIFYITCFITGVIYDLMYFNMIFLHGFIYVFLAFLSYKMLGEKSFFIKSLVSYFILIIAYVLILLLFTFLLKKRTIYEIIHLLYDGVVINILYYSLVYLVFSVINWVFGNRLKKRTY